MTTTRHGGPATAPARETGPAAAVLVPAALAIAAAAALAATFDGSMSPWLSGAASAAVGVAGALLARPARAGAPASRGSAPDAAPDAAPDDAAGFDERLVELRAMRLRDRERGALLDALADALVLVDAHGETRFANRAAETVLGEGASAAGTRRAVDALPPAVLRAVGGVLAGGVGASRRIECHRLDDESAPLVVLVVAIAAGDDAFAAIVARDVRAEREADRMKSEFVAKASHELRTPLASIRAYAEMLADGEIEDGVQRAECLATIQRETVRLSGLVDRMLDIQRIESGLSRAESAPVDLAALAAECVAEQRAAAEARRIALVLPRAVQGAVVQGDAGLLKQVLVNLVSNGVKYTPEGGRVEVEVDVDGLARTAVVSVRDTGIGIPEHARSRLFTPFYRVENHERFAKGTGLGLNLCRNIVERMHGGQIGVDSTVGAGSRFWFTVPMEQAGRKAA
ncbi:MAG: Sensor histidine kinase YycG [Planctomycetota bacterium]